MQFDRIDARFISEFKSGAVHRVPWQSVPIGGCSEIRRHPDQQHVAVAPRKLRPIDVVKPTLRDTSWLVQLMWEVIHVRPEAVDQSESVNDGAREPDDHVRCYGVDLLNTKLLDLMQSPTLNVGDAGVAKQGSVVQRQRGDNPSHFGLAS